MVGIDFNRVIKYDSKESFQSAVRLINPDNNLKFKDMKELARNSLKTKEPTTLVATTKKKD